VYRSINRQYPPEGQQRNPTAPAQSIRRTDDPEDITLDKRQVAERYAARRMSVEVDGRRVT